MIRFGLCRRSDPKATKQDPVLTSPLFLLTMFKVVRLMCSLICSIEHTVVFLCADASVPVLFLFIGSALTSGTTRIRATRTRM